MSEVSSPTIGTTRSRRGIGAVLVLVASVIAALAAVATPADAAVQCWANTHTLRLYLPSTVPASVAQAVNDAANANDVHPTRGVLLGQFTVRQELRTNATRTTVTNATAFPVTYVSSTGGTLGVTFAAPTNTSSSTPQPSIRSTAQTTLTLRTPFGAWNPNYNYTISILGNANGYAYVSPSTDNPSAGIYVQSTLAYGC